MKILEAILKIIDRLMDRLDAYLRQRDYDDRQQRRADAAADPGGAFADHFGVRKPVSDDAKTTDKADPEG